jgi:hypothetical protein
MRERRACALQRGPSVGEDDNVRAEDGYGRLDA